MKIDNLFDLSHTAHAALFDGVTYPWEILSRIKAYVDERVKDAPNNVLVGENTIVEPGAYIQGPAIIGDNCVIRATAYIREYAIIGDGCIVGNSTEVKNSLLFNDVQIPHYNYVGDSILGYTAHLGAGAILSNFKSAQATISVMLGDTRIDTGLQKCGAFIGDHADIGSNAVIAPGAIIGKQSVVYPLAFIRGVVPQGMIVKVRQQQEMVEKQS